MSDGRGERRTQDGLPGRERPRNDPVGRPPDGLTPLEGRGRALGTANEEGRAPLRLQDVECSPPRSVSTSQVDTDQTTSETGYRWRCVCTWGCVGASRAACRGAVYRLRRLPPPPPPPPARRSARAAPIDGVPSPATLWLSESTLAARGRRSRRTCGGSVGWCVQCDRGGDSLRTDSQARSSGEISTAYHYVFSR